MTKKIANVAVTLPRETNPVRIASQFRRSVRLARVAVQDARKRPNAGTKGRRRDRVLAAWVMSRKLRFVRVYGRTDIHGPAKLGAVRKAARSYRNALAQWRNYYQGSHTI